MDPVDANFEGLTPRSLDVDVMSDSPRVSVVIPVYNAERFVRAAIESICTQTFTDLEIIVIDDGSRDGTAGIIGEFVDNPRVRIITHQQNLGVVASLNEGVGLARAPLIARLDADDWCSPRRIEQQVELLDRDPDVVLCATYFEMVDAEGRVLQRVETFPAFGRLCMALASYNCIGHSTTVFRKDAAQRVGGYSPGMTPVEDFDLWIRLLAIGKAAVVPSVEVRYLDNPTGISATQRAKQDEEGRRLSAQWLCVLAGESARGARQGPVFVTRRWGTAARRLRRRVRASGDPVEGIALQGRIGAFRALRDRSLIVRHLLVGLLCPRLYVGGLVERRAGAKR